MLHQFFITTTECFELSAITAAAKEIMNKMIIKETRNEFYDEFHQVDENGICYCAMHSNCGIPSLKQIGLLGANQINIF